MGSAQIKAVLAQRGADLLRIVIQSDPVDPEVDSLADVVLVQPLVGDAQRRQQQEEERARRHLHHLGYEISRRGCADSTCI